MCQPGISECLWDRRKETQKQAHVACRREQSEEMRKEASGAFSSFLGSSSQVQAPSTLESEPGRNQMASSHPHQRASSRGEGETLPKQM